MSFLQDDLSFLRFQFFLFFFLLKHGHALLFCVFSFPVFYPLMCPRFFSGFPFGFFLWFWVCVLSDKLMQSIIQKMLLQRELSFVGLFWSDKLMKRRELQAAESLQAV